MDVHIEYHHGNGHSDRAWVAVLMRRAGDDAQLQPWALDGALVGMGTTTGAAVEDLTALARYVVINGSNALMEHPLPLPDREWLFTQIHATGECEQMHAMIRAARQAAETGGTNNG